MKKSAYFLIISFAFILTALQAISQQNIPETQQKKYSVTLKDGSVMQGTLVSENPEEIVLATENTGTLTIKKEKIKSMILLTSSNYRKGKVWFPNPDYSRYFISPGIQIGKGEGYYQNIDLSVNTVSYGVTNFFSIGGGVELYSTLSGHPIFLVMPKFGFKVANSLWLGAGALYVNAFEGIGNFGGAGIGYGTITFGNQDNNISGGVGWGWWNGKWSDKPIITVSGMTRLSRRIGLVTENWFVPDYSVFSYGVRFLGEKIAVDIGLVNSRDIAKTFPIGLPAFIDFVLKF